jgi:glycosyltransferase involved in cell wall biosynthesis
MNILYITQWCSSIGGGGEVVFHNLATRMANRGHNVEMICGLSCDVSSYKMGKVTINAIKPKLRIPPPSITENAIFILRAVLKGYQIVRKNNIELIHANNLASAIAGSILARISNKPLVTTIHDVFSSSSSDYWNQWVKQNDKISSLTSKIGPTIEKITVKMPTNIIHTVSDSSKEDLVRFGTTSPIKVIPNGLDLPSYTKFGSDIEYQNFVLFVGRLVFYKNLNTVIASFQDVVKKSPDSKLYVVGDGPMRNKWEKMVSDMGLTKSIVFNGYVSDERKIELLSKCSALLLPSFVEGFGLVILESFAMNKPVLVADAKPSNELVDDGVDGFILPINNPTNWSEKISFLLDNKDICKKMGVNGRTKLEKKYSLDLVVNEMESLYQSLAGQGLRLNNNSMQSRS